MLKTPAFLNKIDAIALLNKGIRLREQGEYNKAIKRFDKALDINPNKAEIWCNKGIVLDKQGEYEAAIECFDRALDINPKNVGSWFHKGHVLGTQGKYEAAIECFDTALKINPNLAKTWYNKGTALYLQGKYNTAIECFDMALKNNPNIEQIWHNKGHALYKQGKYEAAIECFNIALDINPNKAVFWYNKGHALYEQGEYGAAIECFDRALDINPKNAESWSNKGSALYKLDKYNMAIKCFDKALKIDSNKAGIWCNKGSALAAQGELEAAIKYFDKALEINPNKAESLSYKGRGLYRQGEYNKAIKYFDKALEINPNDAESLSHKGWALYRQGEYNKAIECFDKVLEINPNKANTWNHKGQALYRQGLTLYEQGEYNKAIKCFDKVLDINPNKVKFWNNKANALYKLDKYNMTIKCFDKALDINPNKAGIWCNKGSALAAQGELEAAIECFDKTLEINPNDASAWNYKGLTLKKQKNSIRLLRACEKAKEAVAKFNQFIFKIKNSKAAVLERSWLHQSFQVSPNWVCKQFEDIECKFLRLIKNSAFLDFILTLPKGAKGSQQYIKYQELCQKVGIELLGKGKTSLAFKFLNMAYEKTNQALFKFNEFISKIKNGNVAVLEQSWLHQSFQVSPNWVCKQFENIKCKFSRLIENLDLLRYIFTLPKRAKGSQHYIKYQELCQKVGMELFGKGKTSLALIFLNIADKKDKRIEKLIVACWGKILGVRVSPEKKNVKIFKEKIEYQLCKKLTLMESTFYLNFIKPNCLCKAEVLSEFLKEINVNKNQANLVLLKNLIIVYTYCRNFLKKEGATIIKLEDKTSVTINSTIFRKASTDFLSNNAINIALQNENFELVKLIVGSGIEINTKKALAEPALQKFLSNGIGTNKDLRGLLGFVHELNNIINAEQSIDTNPNFDRYLQEAEYLKLALRYLVEHIDNNLFEDINSFKNIIEQNIIPLLNQNPPPKKEIAKSLIELAQEADPLNFVNNSRNNYIEQRNKCKTLVSLANKFLSSHNTNPTSNGFFKASPQDGKTILDDQRIKQLKQGTIFFTNEPRQIKAIVNILEKELPTDEKISEKESVVKNNLMKIIRKYYFVPPEKENQLISKLYKEVIESKNEYSDNLKKHLLAFTIVNTEIGDFEIVQTPN